MARFSDGPPRNITRRPIGAPADHAS
jgi:hypothetical protein